MKKVKNSIRGVENKKLGSVASQLLKGAPSLDELIKRIETQWKSLYVGGNVKGAFEFLRSIDLFDRGSVHWAIRNVLLAYTEVDLGLFDDARKLTEEAEEILKDTAHNKYFALLKMTQGLLFLRLSDTTSALKALEDAVSTYRRIGDKKSVAKVYNLIAQVHYMRSNWREALEKTQMAIDLAKEAGAEKDIPFYLVNRGLVHILLGEWSKAKEDLEKALDISELEEEYDHSVPYQALGFLYIHQREWELARLYLEKALELAKARGTKRNEAIAREYLGELSYETGKLEEALDQYKKVYEVLGKENLGDFLNQIERRKADVLIKNGEADKAIDSSELALTVSRQMGDRFEEALSLRALGLAKKAKGFREEAALHLKEAIKILEEIGEKFERARTCIELGKILKDGTSTERKESLVFLLKANDLADQLESPYLKGIANYLLSQLKLKEDDTDGALLYLDEAENALRESREREIFEEVLRFRRKVEDHMVEAALRASQGYSMLERWRMNSFSVEELVFELSNRLNADRAFLATSTNDGNYSVLTSLNLNRQQLSKILDYLGSCNLRDRVPITASRVEFEPLLNESFIAIPFNVGIGMKALLFLSRSSTIPFSQDHITFLSLSADLFAYRLQLKGNEELLKENLRLKQQLLEEARYFGIVTRNERMLDILTTIDRITTSSIPILLQGETGTGKELIARAIHYSSDRKNKPFIPLNCANIPEALLESELFGHKRGAFTDAKEDKKGWFEVANGGTIFLDEIAEMGPAAQAKILRFLEHHEIIPLGGRESIKVDVRIIAATNKDLEEEVKKGNFREDLYYRLKVFQISLPPLRERKEDIPILANYFIEKFSKEAQKTKPPRLHPKALEVLVAYDWPGNVRELENEIRRAVVILPDGQEEITPDFLTVTQKVKKRDIVPLEVRLEQAEKEAILEALERAGGVKVKAAEYLGIPESTLRRKMKKYNL